MIGLGCLGGPQELVEQRAATGSGLPEPLSRPLTTCPLCLLQPWSPIHRMSSRGQAERASAARFGWDELSWEEELARAGGAGATLRGTRKDKAKSKGAQQQRPCISTLS